MATAGAAGVADVGRSRMRPCSSGCWYCRRRSVRSLDGAIRNLVPMRSRFRVALVRVTCSCRRCNAGDVRKLTCKKSVPARSCTRRTRRPWNPAGDCRHIGVQLQVWPRVRNQRPKNENGPKSPLQKDPNSPHRKRCATWGPNALLATCCVALRAFYTAGKLQVRLESTGSDRCVVANVGTRTCVRSRTCIARAAVGDLRVSVRTRTATCNRW